jgi:hypothetical protein
VLPRSCRQIREVLTEVKFGAAGTIRCMRGVHHDVDHIISTKSSTLHWRIFRVVSDHATLEVARERNILGLRREVARCEPPRRVRRFHLLEELGSWEDYRGIIRLSCGCPSHPGDHDLGGIIIPGQQDTYRHSTTRVAPLLAESGQKFRHAGLPLWLPGMWRKVAMRSRCSGVSGGNESTTVRTCSARTAARSGIAGSVVLGGGAGAVRVGCVGGCGSGPGELLASISGVVAVGRACSAFLCVLLVLGRCCEWFGLCIRCFFLSPGAMMGWSGAFRRVLTRLPPAGVEYASWSVGESVGMRFCVGADFVGCRSFDGCPNVCCEVAAHPS